MPNACGFDISTGITLLRGDESQNPTVWEPLGGILTMPELDWTAREGTCRGFGNADVATGNTLTFVSKFKTGLAEAAPMSFELGLISGNPSQEQLFKDFHNYSDTGKIPFRIAIPNAATDTIEFRALVTHWGLRIPEEQADDTTLVIPVTLTPTGDPTWLSAAA